MATAARTSTDKCLLCEERDATQKNSHIIPAALLKSLIGKRDKEHSYVIDTATATIDEYYGRDRLDNPSTEIKEHSHARDFYFCPDCERELGKLESRVCPPLTDQIRDPKFSSNYRTKSTGDLVIEELPKVSADDFNVFFLSIILRQALQRKFDDGVSVFSDNDVETIRLILNSYLWGDDETYQTFNNLFGLMIFSAESFDDPTANMTSALSHREKPHIFLINEFWVFVYKMGDLINGRSQPNTYFHIPPFLPYLNFSGKTPNIVILPKDVWKDVLEQWNRSIAPVYRLRKKLIDANAILSQQNKRIKKKKKKAKRLSRASKRKLRKR